MDFQTGHRSQTGDVDFQTGELVKQGAPPVRMRDSGGLWSRRINIKTRCNSREGGHLRRRVFLPLPLLLLLLLGVALAARPQSRLPAGSPAGGGLDWQAAAAAASGTNNNPAHATLADPAGDHQDCQDRRGGAQQQDDGGRCPRPAMMPGQIDHADFPAGRNVWDVSECVSFL